MLTSSSSLLALDIGTVRIGVAAANAVARIPHPLTTITNDETVLAHLMKLCSTENAALIVVGLPRSMQGDHTDQTRLVESFISRLKQVITLPVYWQDEALTSVKAEQELKARGKPYAKGDIDSLAATYILEDFLQEHPEIRAI
jgi:putative Holliday junction resolvase